MFKAFLILSISVLTTVLSLKPAMAADSKASAKAKSPGQLMAQNSSAHLAQTEATAGIASSADSSASGINLSKIPMSSLPQVEQTAKSFSLTVGAERASRTVSDGSAGSKMETSLLLSPRYQLTENLSILSKTFFTQEEYGPRNSSLSDTQINLTLKGAKINEELSTSYSLNGFAPTNEQNRKGTSFQGAGSLGVKLSGAYTFADLSYTVSYRRNVHEFTVSAAGSPNIRDVVGQTVTADIPLSEKFSLSFAGIYRSSWTYQNSYRQGFSLDADLNFEAVKNLSFNVGTSNEGSALKANGKDSNISFYDEKSSVIRAGVTYVL